MAKSIPKTQATPPAARTSENAKNIGNRLLLGLPPQELAQLLPSLEFVRLKLHQVLYEAGDQVKSLYFLNDGLVSVLTEQTDGETVEVGLIGNEGFVGSPIPFGFTTTLQRLVIQGDATGYRLDVSNYRKSVSKCPSLERQLQRFALILSMQSTQLAACNRLHDVDERLARWCS